MKSQLFSLCFVPLTILSVATSYGDIEYKITDIGRLIGADSFAYGINDSGQVVGEYKLQENPDMNHAFLWQDGNVTDLGTFGGYQSYAGSINNAGVVAGTSSYSVPFYTETAFKYSRENGLVDIGPTGCLCSQAIAINNLNQIIGSYGISGRIGMVQFLYDEVNGIMELPTLEGGICSYAWAINDAGKVVGGSYTKDEGPLHAYLYDSFADTLTDLGTPPGCSESCAWDINNTGQIVGWSSTSSAEPRAFIYDSVNGFTDLGVLGYDTSWAYAINDMGQVVGFSQSPRTALFEAFIWQDGQMTNLNDLIPANSGWVLREARDINNIGQIVGQGKIDGESRAFLLDPIPEPSSVCLLVFGAVTMLRKYRR